MATHGMSQSLWKSRGRGEGRQYREETKKGLFGRVVILGGFGFRDTWD
jgi:hypothetical protein